MGEDNGDEGGGPEYTQCKCASRCRCECGLRAVHPNLDAGVCACISLHLVSRCSQVCSIGISNVGEMLALFASSGSARRQDVTKRANRKQIRPKGDKNDAILVKRAIKSHAQPHLKLENNFYNF